MGPEELAEILEESLTWRQLRFLAKHNNLNQYSYLGKRGLSVSLAYQAHNRVLRHLKRNNGIHTQ
jgi:hypothetical protein